MPVQVASSVKGSPHCVGVKLIKDHRTPESRHPEVNRLPESAFRMPEPLSVAAHWTKSGLLVQWPQSLSRSLLRTNLPLLSRRLQLPIPIGVDLLLTPGEHVLRRDVAHRAVQADVVVMLDVASTRRRASPSDSGVPGRMHSPLSDLCQRSIFPFD
jgi:hypothetical protein